MIIPIIIIKANTKLYLYRWTVTWFFHYTVEEL